jgi:putative transposase
MGVSIQFESHRVELAGVYEMEHDAGVLEFFDQPPPIKLDYENPGGKRMGAFHTPDFFVIRATAAGWEEWKTEEDLRGRKTQDRLCRSRLTRSVARKGTLRRRVLGPGL